MSYFILSQDERIPDAVVPAGISKIVHKDMLTEARASELDRLTLQFRVQQRDHIEYVDFIERPIPLLSDKLKQLIAKFLPRQKYHPVGIFDMIQMRQDVYWLMIPQRLNCLSPQSEFYRNDTLKRLVIDRTRAGKAPLFQLDGIRETIIVVNLALAESILRRDFNGLKLKKIENEA